MSASDVLKRNTDSANVLWRMTFWLRCLICPCSRNWIWGGLMNNKCFYLMEGACERQLICALKTEPSKLIPGTIIVHI